MNAPWNNEDLRRAFDADFDALVSFASRSKARVGFAYLRADGQADLGRPLDARISARMTHVFALAQMRGIEGASHLVSHGLAALTGPLRAANGSWYAEVVPTSETSATPVPRAILSQRAQSAMIGAAAAAILAGHEDARTLLDDLDRDQDTRWWDPSYGAVRENIDAASGKRSPLRRLSTNLDTAQAYLAAWEATGQRVWFDRARSIVRLVGEVAARCGFALPDFYDEEWRPLPPSCEQPPLELIRPGDTLPGLGLKPRVSSARPTRFSPAWERPRASGCSTRQQHSTTAHSPTAGPIKASAASSTRVTPPASSQPPNACTGSYVKPPAPRAS